MTFKPSSKFILYPLFLLPVLLSLLAFSACSHAPSIRPADETKTADALNVLIRKDYTIHKDGSYDLHLQLKRKILTYKGKKDFADFKFTYNNSYQSVKINKARTTTPNGAVIAANKKECHDIQAPWTAQASIYSHTRQKVINLPSVAVGATIEIDLTLHSQLGFWTSEIFRLTNPIQQKTVTIKIPKGMKSTIFQPREIKPADIQEDGEYTIYRWEVKDIPAIIPEQMMPADENRDNCLLVSTFGSWQQVAIWYAGRIIGEKNSGSDISGRLLQQSGLDTATVDKLYDSLMQRVTPHPIDFLSTNIKPQKPEVTIAKGHGTPVDLALAFYQLLKQQQIPVHLLFTNDNDVILDEFKQTPSPGLLTNPIVRCRGRDYSFRQQELPPGFNGCEGQLALDLIDGTLKPIITFFNNRRYSKISLRPNGQGLLAGSLHMVLTGQPAISVRDQLRYLTPEELQVATSRILHGIDPLAARKGPFKTTGIDNPEQPVTIDFNFVIPRELPFAGGYYFLNLPLPTLADEYAVLREKRRNPLLITESFSDDVELQLILPPGFRFKTLPVGGKGQLDNLSWESANQIDGDSAFTWSRHINLRRGIISADESYQQFRNAIIKLYAPESRMVMIKPATAASLTQ